MLSTRAVAAGGGGRDLSQVVAQVVEAQLGVGDVGDVRAVGRLALGLAEARLHQAHAQAQEAVHLPHPLAVAPRQVVVHRHHLRMSGAALIKQFPWKRCTCPTHSLWHRPRQSSNITTCACRVLLS